jgi:hypothetical protein
MLAQIADQDKALDQLICDGKTLRGSAAQPDDADGSSVCHPSDALRQGTGRCNRLDLI